MNLAEASFEMTAGAFQQESDADKRLLVQFSLHPHLNQEKSSKEGRPIYEDRVYVMIIVPGDKDSIVHRPAYDRDFQRFPRQYAAFQQKAADPVIGTPLKAVTWLSASQIKELEYFNVRTVEALADVTDNLASKFHGLQGLKKHAKDFMEASKGQAPLLEVRKQLEQRDSQIEALNAQMAAMAKKLEELSTKEKAK